MSEYGHFSSHFPVFSPKIGKYGPEKTLHLDISHAVSQRAFTCSMLKTETLKQCVALVASFWCLFVDFEQIIADWGT